VSKSIKIALLVVLALVLLSLPALVDPYILQIFILTITYSLLGLGFAFTLKVGLPRFDIAAWWGVGAYTTAVLMWRFHMSFWPTLLIGGLISVGIGWLIFMLAVPRGMIVFLMFGMATSIAIQQVFGAVGYFGGWGGTGIVPLVHIGSFKFSNKPELYYLGLVFLAFNLMVYYALYNSKIGRAWNAIGSSLKLASSVGIDVVKYRMANVMIGNFFLALAGSYYVAYSLVAVPATFGFNNSMYVMMYVVVGGFAHALSGPLIGALIITFIPEYMRVAKEREPIITGIIIILIIIFMPMGILGLVDKRIRPWFSRMMARRRKQPQVSV
jgi:branched-chain amino acid transport system permease protein